MKPRAASGSLVPRRRSAQDMAFTTISSRSLISAAQISRVRVVESRAGERPFNANVLTNAARRLQRSDDFAQPFILESLIRSVAHAGPEIKHPKLSTSLQLPIPSPSCSTSDQVIPSIAAG